MKRRSFTIIEMLAVISIIAILTGILLPVIGTAKRRAHETKSRARVKALEVAIKSYESTYNVLPFTSPSASGDVLLNTVNYDILIQCLNGINTAGGGGANPRKIRFLELDADNTYTDAWGQDFNVALDLTYDGIITDGYFYWFKDTQDDLSRTIAIWSKGFDKVHSATDTDGTNKDNLNSWEMKR